MPASPAARTSSIPGAAAYNASKFAVVTLSEGLYHDLALRQARIKVSVLCPGWVKTRIAESERHRSPQERGGPAKLDAVGAKVGAAIKDAVEHGMAPDQVAERVFAAIAADQFYILTHEESLAAIRIRMEDILQNRQPTLLRI